ncbi:MAG: hypothetical protein JWO77_2337 [Ilumatobacteraceae bacterium]|nr:hypothetical protein [Ilumatobacteraceae bacterium]
MADGTDVDAVDEAASGDQPVRGARRRPPAASPAGFDDPQPLLRIVRSWPWAGWLVGGIVLLRLIAVAGMRLYIYVDSGEYDRIDFSGDWRRPWATPYLYWLIPGSNRGTVVGQALVGAACWATLALCASAWFRLRTSRIAVAVVIGGLGCTTVVTNWDAAKLSESLGLSLTVLVIAAWLNFVRRTDAVTAGLVAMVTLPWLFVRQSLVPTAWLVVAVAGVATVVVWRHRRTAGVVAVRILAVLCVVLAIETAVASATYSHNQEIVHENLLVIVSNRVGPDPARLAWFEDHGMPVPKSGDLSPDSLRDDPAFAHWVAHEGRSTYVRYLATHPWYALTAPLDDFTTVRQSALDEYERPTAMLAPPDSYATSRPVLPSLAEQALFGPGDTGMVITLLVVVLGWTLVRIRRRSVRWAIPLSLVGLAFASLYTGWHGATPELGRLALMGAMGLRIGLFLQLAFLIEDEVVARRDRRAPGGARDQRVARDVAPTS